MDEAGEEALPWDLDEHLNGCLAAYQMKPSYGAAVFFAIEALWGIARDVGMRAKTGSIAQAELDKDWILYPSTTLPVPWIWIRFLSAAWEKYNALHKIPYLYETQVKLNHLFFYRLLKTFLFTVRLTSSVADAPCNRYPPRGTVDEFRDNLGKIADLARTHRARLIFIPEANQFTRTLEEEAAANPYIMAMVTCSEERGVPLIDVMTPMAERGNDDLFVDYIHPSQAGHRFIADIILEELTRREWL